ncbi:MAG TPA: RHS repeat-associated core domain-containing protein [Bryobacteraceae bacterium]|nr:RHS repeat-associated core domain-containing protein [Bryobacteraceae bacterium]
MNPGGGASQRERTFAYDSLKRLSSATNPESGLVSYTYDANGNVKTKTDARGVVATFSYDNLNRVYLKSYTIPGGAADPTDNVTYCYDGQVADTADGACKSPASAIAYGWNRLTELRTATSTTTYTSYDALGRVTGSTQTTGGPPYPFSYLYNLAGGLTGVQYPSARNVSYTYTGAGRIDAVWKAANGSGGNYTSSIKYTPHGALTSMILDGSGLTETTTYNSRLQPVSMQAGSLLTLGYFYCPSGASLCSTNNNGNVRRQTITAGSGFTRTIDYSYTDPMNRLSSATESGGSNEWSETYTYDNYGNRWVSAWGAALPPSGETPTSASWFSTNNRLSGSSYDAAGNQTSLVSFGIGYDAENRQTRTTINSVTAQYAYDGDGRRVKKVSGGVTTVYVYDAQGQLAAEYTSAAGAAPPCYTCYLTADSLGSTRLVSDGHTACAKRYDYRPFGEDIPVGIGDRSTNLCYGVTDPTTIQFTGKERDTETLSSATKGLDYFGARYMSSAQGRFTSPDPIYFQKEFLTDPQRWNLYAYARNNPLRFIDPKGEAIELVGDEEERKKALAALQKGVGAQAGSYLYENKVTTKDKNGNEVTKYYVGIYTNGPDGKGPAFEKVNNAAASLGGIVKSQDVVTFGLVSNGTTLTNDFGNQITIGSINDGRTPGVTSLFNGGQLGVFILDPSTNPGQLPADMMNPSAAPGSVDQGILALHELGHAGYSMGALLDKNTNQSAVDLENMVRKSRDPNAPIRREH